MGTRKTLTKKQLKVIEEMITGEEMTDAIRKAYDCKNDKSAYVIKSNLNKSELFKKELERQSEVKNKIVESEGKKLVEILEKIFPKQERMEILVKIARGKDQRAVLESLKEINKIEGEYPDTKLGIYRALDTQRQKVITEGDLKLIEATEVIEQSRKEIEHKDE